MSHFGAKDNSEPRQRLDALRKRYPDEIAELDRQWKEKNERDVIAAQHMADRVRTTLTKLEAFATACKTNPTILLSPDAKHFENELETVITTIKRDGYFNQTAADKYLPILDCIKILSGKADVLTIDKPEDLEKLTILARNLRQAKDIKPLRFTFRIKLDEKTSNTITAADLAVIFSFTKKLRFTRNVDQGFIATLHEGLKQAGDQSKVKFVRFSEKEGVIRSEFLRLEYVRRSFTFLTQLTQLPLTSIEVGNQLSINNERKTSTSKLTVVAEDKLTPQQITDVVTALPAGDKTLELHKLDVSKEMKLPEVQVLELDGGSVTDCSAFLSDLRRQTTLRKLSFKSVDFNPQKSRKDFFCGVLALPITELEFIECDFTDSELVAFSEVLKDNKTLTSLNLRNSLGRCLPTSIDTLGGNLLENENNTTLLRLTHNYHHATDSLKTALARNIDPNLGKELAEVRQFIADNSQKPSLPGDDLYKVCNKVSDINTLVNKFIRMQLKPSLPLQQDWFRFLNHLADILIQRARTDNEPTIISAHLANLISILPQDQQRAIYAKCFSAADTLPIAFVERTLAIPNAHTQIALADVYSAWSFAKCNLIARKLQDACQTSDGRLISPDLSAYQSIVHEITNAGVSRQYQPCLDQLHVIALIKIFEMINQSMKPPQLQPSMAHPHEFNDYKQFSQMLMTLINIQSRDPNLNKLVKFAIYHAAKVYLSGVFNCFSPGVKDSEDLLLKLDKSGFAELRIPVLTKVYTNRLNALQQTLQDNFVNLLNAENKDLYLNSQDLNPNPQENRPVIMKAQEIMKEIKEAKDATAISSIIEHHIQQLENGIGGWWRSLFGDDLVKVLKNLIVTVKDPKHDLPVLKELDAVTVVADQKRTDPTSALASSASNPKSTNPISHNQRTDKNLETKDTQHATPQSSANLFVDLTAALDEIVRMPYDQTNAAVVSASASAVNANTFVSNSQQSGESKLEIKAADENGTSKNKQLQASEQTDITKYSPVHSLPTSHIVDILPTVSVTSGVARTIARPEHAPHQ